MNILSGEIDMSDGSMTAVPLNGSRGRKAPGPTLPSGSRSLLEEIWNANRLKGTMK